MCASITSDLLTCPLSLPITGEAYMRMNKLADAEYWYRESLRVKPDHIPAHLTYGKLLAMTVRTNTMTGTSDSSSLRADLYIFFYFVDGLKSFIGVQMLKLPIECGFHCEVLFLPLSLLISSPTVNNHTSHAVAC